MRALGSFAETSIHSDAARLSMRSLSLTSFQLQATLSYSRWHCVLAGTADFFPALRDAHHS